MRAALRYLDVSTTTLPLGCEDLIFRLGLVDIRASRITCQARCKKNAGICSKQIDQRVVKEKIVELSAFVAGVREVGLDGDGVLREGLRGVVRGLLCKNVKGHCTEEQVEVCLKRVGDEVEEWRKKWVDGNGAKGTRLQEEEERGEEEDDEGKEEAEDSGSDSDESEEEEEEEEECGNCMLLSDELVKQKIKTTKAILARNLWREDAKELEAEIEELKQTSERANAREEQMRRRYAELEWNKNFMQILQVASEGLTRRTGEAQRSLTDMRRVASSTGDMASENEGSATPTPSERKVSAASIASSYETTASAQPAPPLSFKERSTPQKSSRKPDADTLPRRSHDQATPVPQHNPLLTPPASASPADHSSPASGPGARHAGRRKQIQPPFGFRVRPRE